MLPRGAFDCYTPDKDAYNVGMPSLRLGDLKPVDATLPVRLSILLSVNSNRRGQLGRCLETLARQEWREFEVLVADNGHPQDLGPMLESFQPYLRLTHVRNPRDKFRSCPSHGFKSLMPLAKGDVWAIAQAEIMFDPQCARLLWAWHYDRVTEKQADIRVVSRETFPTAGRPRWVNLKPYCLSQAQTMDIDSINWHDDVYALRELPKFWDHTEGFAYRTNRFVDDEAKEWPWWMVASCKASDPIWQDIPLKDGHAVIDMWLINYRHMACYADLTPLGHAMCFHQRHVVTAVGVEDEAGSVEVPHVIAKMKAEGREMPAGDLP